MVLVPGFYRGVRPLTAEEGEFFDAIDFDLEKYKKGLGVTSLVSNTPREVLEHRWRKVMFRLT